MSIVNLLGAVLSLTLPWSDRIGLLIAVYLNLFQAAVRVTSPVFTRAADLPILSNVMQLHTLTDELTVLQWLCFTS